MGKKRLIISLLFVTGFFIAPAQTTVVDSILSGGVMRSYRLYVPAVYTGTTARPLIINLHGYTSNAAAQQYYGNFMPIADTANILVVHPQGTNIAGQPFWNAGFIPGGVDDVQFLSDLIDSLNLVYNIDLQAVYATGMSNGGFMSHTLACALNHRIAAIASVAGTMAVNQYSTCVPNRAVPMMQIHGTADPTVPYAGNSTMVPVDTIVQFWRRNNVCNPTPTFSNVPNTNLGDGCTAEHYLYNGGIQQADVEFFKIIGGEHTWPGALVNIGVTNQDINASLEIWRFFRKYRLSQFVTGVEEKNKISGWKLYPNPAENYLWLQAPYSGTLLIEDSWGRVLKKENIHLGKNSVSINDLCNGVYFLIMENAVNTDVLKFIKQE